MSGHHPISVAGRLVVWVWRWISLAHRTLRARRRRFPPPPLLVVGSSRAGGTCKTDLVEWIASRYPDAAVLCHPTGDEDRWLGARFPGRVFAHRDWLCAWDAARAAGFAIAVCDGGLQDPALDGCPALRLEVSPAPADWRDLHPWGPWREMPARSRQACAVSVESQLRPALSLEGTTPSRQLRAACAVARPEVFFRDLERSGIQLVERVALGDHRRFPKRLLERMAHDPDGWVVSAKDAARGGLPAGVWVARRSLDPVREIQEWIHLELDRISLPGTGSQ
ncbi:MAG TPA: tetraacyldisaccharide 4'-kinase [Fibrobacteria bacterium]|nr:tetraacyldisaccharide 4'-kinase [Fibrobacteria bacterium]